VSIALTAWECNTCSHLWQVRADAEDCCPPTEIKAWMCGGCGRLFRSEHRSAPANHPCRDTWRVAREEPS
jgi:hypothetical protein